MWQGEQRYVQHPVDLPYAQRIVGRLNGPGAETPQAKSGGGQSGDGLLVPADGPGLLQHDFRTCFRPRAPDRDLMSEVTLQKIIQVDIPTRSKVGGEMEIATMGEIELHACIYEARPDVVAVCHGHSDYIQLCSKFGLKLKAFSNEGMHIVVDGYGVYDKP